MANFKCEDKVAIITGGSIGIGMGIAFEFAKHGYAIALVGRNEKNLNTVAEKCVNLGLPSQKVLCIIADFLKDDDIKLIVPKTISKFGRIDVLVNNAGMLKTGDLPNVNMKDYDDVMRVNVRSIVVLSQAALPHLIKTKGNIVNISSVVARNNGFPCLLSYNMSKAAVDHFTRCCSVDLAPKGVRVNSVQPCVIETEIFKRAGLTKNEHEELMESNKVKHPMGRMGTIEDIGRTVVFLASENSSFTTGQTIAIDGSYPGHLTV